MSMQLDQLEENALRLHVQSQYTKKKEKGIFGIFKSKSNGNDFAEFIDELKSLVETSLSTLDESIKNGISEVKNYVEFSQVVAQIRSYIAKHQSTSISHDDASIAWLNKINFPDTEVIDLDEKLNTLIKTINANQFIKKSFSTNTLSFMSQYALVESIQRYLDDILHLIKEGSTFAKWSTFYHDAGTIFQTIFKSIKDLPSTEWEAAFDEIYFHQMIEKYMLPNDFDSKIQQHRESKIYFNKVKLEGLTTMIEPARAIAMDTLKKSNKEVYNALYKKKNIGALSWNSVEDSSFDFVKAYYPIHIHSNLANADKYDTVISFDDTEVNERAHSISSITQEDLQSPDADTNYLYLNTYDYEQTIAELPHAEKIKAAKKLAKQLLSLSQNVSIYQLKTANIICLLPIHDTNHLEQKLDRAGIKHIDTSENLYETLTESILITQRNPYLLIKDHLINTDLVDELDWQLEVMKNFESAGFTIRSVSTTEQLIESSELYDGLMDASSENADSHIEPSSAEAVTEEHD